MNEKIRCITNKGKVPKNECEMMTLIFFEYYRVYIKGQDNSFFYTYSLTYVRKDTSFLLKVINISEQFNKLSIKTVI